jgi:hypothetical protein
MANPNDIVTISLSIQDLVATVSNFGTIAIFANAPHLAGTFATYDVSPDGLAAMILAGFTAGDAAYKMVERIAAQQPSVSQVKIFSRTTTNAQEVEFTPLETTEGYTYHFYVYTPDGVANEIEYVVGASETATTISTALQALLDALTGVSATDNTGSVTLEPTTAGDRFHLEYIDSQLSVEDVSADAGIATDLAAALAVDADFYGVLIDANCKAEIVAAAAWAGTNHKPFLGLTIDSEVDDNGVTDDVVTTVMATNNPYARVFYRRHQSSYVNAGLMGRQFAQDPGSSNWSNQTIIGAPVDGFSATELGVIKTKGGITYEAYLGIAMTREPKGHRYLDITRGADKLESDIQAALITFIANNEAVRYTDPWIGMLGGVVAAQLAASQGVGFVQPGWVLTTPKAADALTADRTNRVLRGIEFSGQLGGAINEIPLKGTLSP